MSVITGKDGTVKHGNATLGSATELEVTEWSMNITGGALDVSDAGSGDWREKVPGKRKSATGSFNVIAKTDVALLTVNTEVEVHLVEDDTTDTEIYWSGAVIITDMGASVPVEGEDVEKISYSFEAAGEMLRTNNAD